MKNSKGNIFLVSENKSEILQEITNYVPKSNNIETKGEKRPQI